MYEKYNGSLLTNVTQIGEDCLYHENSDGMDFIVMLGIFSKGRSDMDLAAQVIEDEVDFWHSESYDYAHCLAEWVGIKLREAGIDFTLFCPSWNEKEGE